ncbi:MAG: hypothetical protein JWQ71_1126 [Pedosphaera sp.]|nr:hypothetical protein [Pedosphaera sp.]
MILKHEDQLVDFDLNMLEELLCIVDAQLCKLDNEIKQCPDPDSFGLFDLCEGVTGMGFVACQWYLAATCGCLKLDKHDALQFGPFHSCGLTIVQIINHAANYWKHREEWVLKKREKDAMRTIAALSKLGIDCEGDYVLTCALVDINALKTMQFKPLISVLEEWSKKALESLKTDKMKSGI